jgi:hypothetical protein
MYGGGGEFPHPQPMARYGPWTQGRPSPR